MLRLRLLPMLLLAALPMVASAANNDAAKHGFNVRDLVNLERISSPVLSPDGHLVVFALRQTDYAANKGVTSLWFKDLRTRDDAPPRRLLAAGMTGNSPVFAPNGESVY